MDAVVHFLQPLDLHPVIDHFSVALLMTGVFIDLVASFFPLRAWLRYMALTLMILGAIAAGSSFFSGGIEADRIWDTLADPAKAVLGRHADFAKYTAIAFGVLAFWRILIESIGAFAGSRPIYLIFAVVAVCFLGYVGHLGGKLVYTYGVGTELVTARQSATPTATPTPFEEVPTALPTVFVPAPRPTPLPTAAPPSASEPPPGAAAEPAKPGPTASPSPSPDKV
jgi:uncharacterized membrane protein